MGKRYFSLKKLLETMKEKNIEIKDLAEKIDYTEWRLRKLLSSQASFYKMNIIILYNVLDVLEINVLDLLIE